MHACFLDFLSRPQICIRMCLATPTNLKMLSSFMLLFVACNGIKGQHIVKQPRTISLSLSVPLHFSSSQHSYASLHGLAARLAPLLWHIVAHVKQLQQQQLQSENVSGIKIMFACVCACLDSRSPGSVSGNTINMQTLSQFN